MSLELFGWILVGVGLFLVGYGCVMAVTRNDVEDQLHHARYDDPHRTPPDLPRVTEQEKREAFKVAAILPFTQDLIDDGLWPVIRVAGVRVLARPVLYDWETEGGL